MKKLEEKKIALVHDFLTEYGGAEKVLEVLGEMFPQAPIFTLLYDKERIKNRFSDKVIVCSYLQKMPKFLRRNRQWLLPLCPVAPETFDLRDFDLVISSSGAWSKGIVTKLHTIHVAYIHSPMRFIWDYNQEYVKEEKRSGWNWIIQPFFNYLRVWDRLAADRPDYLIANSEFTRMRIKKFYRKESRVIYPPVFRLLSNSDTEDPELVKKLKNRYFLVVSRLSAYKKIDAIIEAFNKLELPLVIVGQGKEMENLKKISGKNIHFTGWISDRELDKFYQGARAFVFAGVDDFGIAPVEAMLRGVPVIAIRKGGVKEIVKEGVTGEFFDEPATEVIADGIRRFIENETTYDKSRIIKEAEEFSKERFKREIEAFILEKMDQF